MNKIFSFFNQEAIEPLQKNNLSALKSITVMENKTIVFYFEGIGEKILSPKKFPTMTEEQQDTEVTDLFSPKPLERCVSTTIEQEGLITVSPDFTCSSPSKDEEEYVNAYVTPDRKTKPCLVNVSPKRILKRAKMVHEEEKKDN
jgi:hypothetical protein